MRNVESLFTINGYSDFPNQTEPILKPQFKRLWEKRVQERKPTKPELPYSWYYSTQIFETNETHLTQEDFPEYSDLIQSFIDSRGIESVNNRLVRLEGQSSQGEQPRFVENVRTVKVATGHVFELLTHQWLKQQNSEGLFFDPEYCNRIFKNIRKNNGVSLVPDGVHVSFTGNKPVIDWVIECKTNPIANAYATNISLHRTKRFVANNSGRAFRLPFPTIYDLANGVQSRSLRISSNPRTSLIIPSNRFYNPPDNIEVIKTPFNSLFVSRVTHSVLNDISRN